MPQFQYKAVDAKGKKIAGRIHATNLLEVEHRLASQDQDLISCVEVAPSPFRFGRRKLTRRDLINMVFQLEQLTKSGVPLLEGLRDLRDSAPLGYYRDVLTSITESIEGGKTFSQSLRDFPNDFDSVFTALISVGEESGELPRILKDMGETLRWADELMSTTVKIMMYPTIVAVVVFGVTAFLMIYLVPMIIPFVAEMGGEIPLHTKVLIAVSGAFVDYWWLIIGVPIAAAVAVKTAARTRPEFRMALDRFKLRLPLIGPITFKIKIARFANYMALLYASGITVLRALDICRDLMDNQVMSKAIATGRQSIADGRGISESFASVDLFPPLVVRMLRVGENTGNLDDALLNVSYFYNREVQEAIDKIEPAISPVLTVIMGTMLGWIMMSVLGPVWDAVAKVG